jgi:hypothetical protein
MAAVLIEEATPVHSTGVAPSPDNRQLPVVDSQSTNTDAPRPGSRAARMAQPLSRDVLKMLAEQNGVCVRPIPLRREDRLTGETTVVDIPCGARLSSKCKPCADRNRKLRMQQIREGWHLEDEPLPPVDAPDEETKAIVALRCSFVFDREQAVRSSEWEQVAELDAAIVDLDEELASRPVRGTLTKPAESKPRRARSTKRRADAVELPRLPVDSRTIGKTYTGPDGKTHRPSMLLTVTTGSYGAVHTGSRTRRGMVLPCECGTLHHKDDPALGTPIDADAYDYRSAALDAVFFAAGLDRLWQNLRRAAGYNVQYAGAVEMQKRLAPHAHYAMRGTLPKALLRQVAAGTYHQVWWPQFTEPVYQPNKLPKWDETAAGYVDPTSGVALPTWDQAVDALNSEEAQPAYVMRFGRIDARGIEHGSKDAERSIRYVTKYITKDLAEQADPASGRQRDHFDRLHAELSVIPCSPTCANWLIYGVQPAKAKPGMNPGRCAGKVHQRNTLGFTGRRVLISRQWSGKTLADHRHDNRSWIRTVLSGALADNEDPALNAVDNDAGRYSFAMARDSDPDVPNLQLRIMRTIEMRARWKQQLTRALYPPDPVPANEINPTFATV